MYWCSDIMHMAGVSGTIRVIMTVFWTSEVNRDAKGDAL